MIHIYIIALIAFIISGCSEINCPGVSTPKGTIVVYKEKYSSNLVAFIACSGQYMRVLPYLSFKACPTDSEQTVLGAVIDATCPFNNTSINGTAAL
jgi:hypothetical protein